MNKYKIILKKKKDDLWNAMENKVKEEESKQIWQKLNGLIITIATLLSSIATWAILLCIAKTSKNIREIRNKQLSQQPN